MFHPSQQALKKIMLKDLLSVYPQLQGIRGEVAWGGYMGYARHKMPQLGQLKPGEWYCQGFGGHGMATTTMGGELIASAIANNDDTWQAFAPFGLDYVGKTFWSCYHSAGLLVISNTGRDQIAAFKIAQSVAFRSASSIFFPKRLPRKLNCHKQNSHR